MTIWPINFCFDVKPRLRFFTIIIKSSKNPNKANPNRTNNSESISVFNVAYFNAIVLAVMRIDKTIIIPPKVGVPVFA